LKNCKLGDNIGNGGVSGRGTQILVHLRTKCDVLFKKRKSALEIFLDVIDIWKSKVKFSSSQTPSILKAGLGQVSLEILSMR